MRKISFTSWACASVLFAAALSAPGASAAPQEDPWITIRADDVEIYSQAGLDTTRDTAAKLLRMRAAIGKVTQLNVRSATPIRVFLFRDAAASVP